MIEPPKIKLQGYSKSNSLVQNTKFQSQESRPTLISNYVFRPGCCKKFVEKIASANNNFGRAGSAFYFFD